MLCVFNCVYTIVGVGIPVSKQATMFEAFNTLQVGQTVGTGLGLFGLKQKAISIGGCCGMHSNTEAETGSVFWFKVPYVADLEEDVILYSQLHDIGLKISDSIVDVSNEVEKFRCVEMHENISLVKAIVKQQNLTAMVVDDSESIRKLMKRALEQIGFNDVVLVENGLKGLNAMKERQFSMVFSDVQMPILSGPEVSVL